MAKKPKKLTALFGAKIVGQTTSLAWYCKALRHRRFLVLASSDAQLALGQRMYAPGILALMVPKIRRQQRQRSTK